MTGDKPPKSKSSGGKKRHDDHRSDYYYYYDYDYDSHDFPRNKGKIPEELLKDGKYNFFDFEEEYEYSEEEIQIGGGRTGGRVNDGGPVSGIPSIYLSVVNGRNPPPSRMFESGSSRSSKFRTAAGYLIEPFDHSAPKNLSGLNSAKRRNVKKDTRHGKKLGKLRETDTDDGSEFSSYSYRSNNSAYRYLSSDGRFFQQGNADALYGASNVEIANNGGRFAETRSIDYDSTDSQEMSRRIESEIASTCSDYSEFVKDSFNAFNPSDEHIDYKFGRATLSSLSGDRRVSTGQGDEKGSILSRGSRTRSEEQGVPPPKNVGLTQNSQREPSKESTSSSSRHEPPARSGGMRDSYFHQSDGKTREETGGVSNEPLDDDTCTFESYSTDEVRKKSASMSVKESRSVLDSFSTDGAAGEGDKESGHMKKMDITENDDNRHTDAGCSYDEKRRTPNDDFLASAEQRSVIESVRKLHLNLLDGSIKDANDSLRRARKDSRGSFVHKELRGDVQGRDSHEEGPFKKRLYDENTEQANRKGLYGNKVVPVHQNLLEDAERFADDHGNRFAIVPSSRFEPERVIRAHKPGTAETRQWVPGDVVRSGVARDLRGRYSSPSRREQWHPASLYQRALQPRERDEYSQRPLSPSRYHSRESDCESSLAQSRSTVQSLSERKMPTEYAGEIRDDVSYTYEPDVMARGVNNRWSLLPADPDHGMAGSNASPYVRPGLEKPVRNYADFELKPRRRTKSAISNSGLSMYSFSSSPNGGARPKYNYKLTEPRQTRTSQIRQLRHMSPPAGQLNGIGPLAANQNVPYVGSPRSNQVASVYGARPASPMRSYVRSASGSRRSNSVAGSQSSGVRKLSPPRRTNLPNERLFSEKGRANSPRRTTASPSQQRYYQPYDDGAAKLHPPMRMGSPPARALYDDAMKDWYRYF